MILKVKQNIKINKNCFNLILERPKGFNFYPGQYLDIELPVEDKFGKTRAFTISSSPTEHFLMITPQIGKTPFKKFMEKIKAGDSISASHPAGTFTLDESCPAVFIAGGIGITPFRSIIKYVFDQQTSTQITLIYSNSADNFLFKNELDLWQKQVPSLQIIYHNSSKIGRLNKKTFQQYPIPHTLYPIFYLAGSHEFVNSMEANLLGLGVDQTNIRTDKFDGY